MSRVSIVLPTYNGEEYLEDALRCCVDQTYEDLEVIVVDDGSTDSTPRILARLAREDARVKIIRHRRNRKLPAALNTGHCAASGEFLTWTSDDNRFAPAAIARMVGFLERHRDVAFVYSDYWLMDEQGEVGRRVHAGPPSHLDEACFVACFLYRRHVYEVCGEYDTSLFRIEDYEYWLRVSKRFRLGWLQEPLYYYRRHDRSLTAEDDLEDRARRFDLVRARHFGADRRRYRRVLSQLRIADAFERHARGDRRGVVRQTLKAARLDPGLLANRGVASILAQAVVGAERFERVKRLTGSARRRDPEGNDGD